MYIGKLISGYFDRLPQVWLISLNFGVVQLWYTLLAVIEGHLSGSLSSRICAFRAKMGPDLTPESLEADQNILK